ncbi:fimbrial protein [Proteus mirabilis]|nr:fimbrial protein [Proteus mirabilis]WFC29464.1 fimbrial protein [Proteus mirabilis]
MRATPGIVYINITGNVIAPPPCLINDGKMIEVNFGEVMSTRINDSNYKQPIEYTAICQKRPTNAMKVYITGNATGFDSKIYRDLPKKTD